MAPANYSAYSDWNCVELTTHQTPYWVALSRVLGNGPARMRLLLDRFHSAEAAWNALHADLLEAGLDARTADAVLTARRTRVAYLRPQCLQSLR